MSEPTEPRRKRFLAGIDWRAIAALAVLSLGVGSIGSTLYSSSLSRSKTDLIAANADQLRVVRASRDEANARALAAEKRADDANRRANDITVKALDRIQSVECTEYQQTAVLAVFAGLVATSPTATDEEKAVVAPFVNPPTKPEGCP